MDDNAGGGGGGGGGSRVSDVFRYYKMAKWLMKSAGFSLRKWCSNNPELMSLIQREECHNNSSPEDSTCEDSTFSTYQLAPGHSNRNLMSVFGIKWDVVSDKFVSDLIDLMNKAEELVLNC